jgi:hypothetical protein
VVLCVCVSLMYVKPVPHGSGHIVKMCFNETCSEVQISKYLSDTSPIQNSLTCKDSLLQLFYDISLECANRKVQSSHEELKLNTAYQPLV